MPIVANEAHNGSRPGGCREVRQRCAGAGMRRPGSPADSKTRMGVVFPFTSARNSPECLSQGQCRCVPDDTAASRLANGELVSWTRSRPFWMCPLPYLYGPSPEDPGFRFVDACRADPDESRSTLEQGCWLSSLLSRSDPRSRDQERSLSSPSGPPDPGATGSAWPPPRPWQDDGFMRGGARQSYASRPSASTPRRGRSHRTHLSVSLGVVPVAARGIGSRSVAGCFVPCRGAACWHGPVRVGLPSIRACWRRVRPRDHVARDPKDDFPHGWNGPPLGPKLVCCTVTRSCSSGTASGRATWR